MSNGARSLSILAALAAGAASCVFAVTLATSPELLVRMEGDYLHISAPHLNFLSGKTLERLKDGASVAFIGQLTVTSTPNAIIPDARSVARFALSYDIWEERFSIAKMGEKPDSRRSISHLSVQAAQNWCLDNLAIERSLVPSDRLIYVQLDLRIEDPRDQAGIVGDPGINITRLIEIFSRPAKSAEPPMVLRNGPFRLADLRKVSGG
ncbi:MAG: hypothetical protein ABSB15_16725 [Bryobacteraceae bacterium]